MGHFYQKTSMKRVKIIITALKYFPSVDFYESFLRGDE